MSNTTGNNDNHRIGYSSAPGADNLCPDQPNRYYGYDHGDYVNDKCDAYDASYYYCDACSRTKHSGFSFAGFEAPHSLHNMLLAFFYYGW